MQRDVHNNSLLTRKQASDYLGIAFPTLKRLVDSGIIPAYRLGKRKVYFKQNEIESALKAVNTSKEQEVQDA